MANDINECFVHIGLALAESIPAGLIEEFHHGAKSHVEGSAPEEVSTKVGGLS